MNNVSVIEHILCLNHICEPFVICFLQKKDVNMKVYSAYKPMILDNEADAAASALEKTAASGRQEKTKVIISLYI